MLSRFILIGFLLIIFVGIVAAQDTSAPSPYGVIIVPDFSDSTVPTELNPLICHNETCNLLTSLLFPMLVAIDPATGLPTPASDDLGGIVASWEITDDGKAWIYHLRDDIMWSDGVPITAYDAFFSYAALDSRQLNSEISADLRDVIQAMIPLDDATLLVIPVENYCDVPVDGNIPVIPYHAFAPEFAEQVDAYFQGIDTDVAAYEEWKKGDHYDLGKINYHPFNYAPNISYGDYVLDTQQAQDYIRLSNIKGNQHIETLSNSGERSSIDRVIAGELAYYENPPLNMWDDLRNNPHINTLTYPSRQWFYIGFNFANPNKPLSYRDADGEIQVQEPHHILSDPTVRRAIQMGINIQELIDIAVQGEGQQVAGYQIPTSWAYNPELAPIPYDPDGAAQLLESAGWRQLRPRSPRICIGCATAQEGTALSLSLLYGDNQEAQYANASLISRQLSGIGVEISANSSGSDAFASAQQQTFDLYLGTWFMSYPVAPDIGLLFEPEEDVFADGYNFISYLNPDVNALFEEAATLSGCDVNQRIELYQEVERLLQDEQPYVWLYTPYEMTIFSDKIQNVVPQPNAPLANIDEWSVWELPK